ncbi:gamma-glutamyltransferase [Aureimonas sp. AU4]|uniref:gamma-glutamyltransferase n=1 Tax=Aureimonas sp. AU4 TaxID=1638163 RepID=UPI00078419D7|nr:gamma-glutamyltransferase [Aureimonas sp. AU4]
MPIRLSSRALSGLLASALVILPAAPAALAASPAPVEAAHGMVVTAQRLASEVGVEVLRQGGNAVDAAVAVGYALAVTYPTAGNLGGGGFMTVRMADGRTGFLDFRERAPQAASRDMYLGPDGKPVAGLSTDGWLAAGVPGSVSGLETARERFGTKGRAELIAPALRLARDGFTLSPGDGESFAEASADLAKDPAARLIYVRPNGSPLQAGDRLVQPDLAAVLQAVSDGGASAFYEGDAARRIVEGSQKGGGILEMEDFKRYRTRELEPVRCGYRELEILSAPPPSSGGTVICQILNTVEAYPLKDAGYGSAQGVHWMTEAMRFAFRDRNQELGDPDFVRNPVERLTSDAYAGAIRARIDDRRAGVSEGLAPVSGEKAETTHYSIVDAAGNAVAVTTTLNGSFGARVVAPGTGILLNNEMDDFTMKPGVPNLYGLVQGEANAIAPGKTPLSSMSPTIVLKDGRPLMVLGTPGGSRIITAVVETFLNVVEYGMDVQEAVDAPRIHHQWLPDRIALEPRALSPDTQRVLREMGHRVEEDADWPVWGEAAAILVGAPRLDAEPAGPGERHLFGAIDSRARAGAAVGY